MLLSQFLMEVLVYSQLSFLLTLFDSFKVLRLFICSLKEQVTQKCYQSCYWILKSVESSSVALKKFYRIPQILLCISIFYKMVIQNTTEAYIFTHYHLKIGQITLVTSGPLNKNSPLERG